MSGSGRHDGHGVDTSASPVGSPRTPERPITWRSPPALDRRHDLPCTASRVSGSRPGLRGRRLPVGRRGADRRRPQDRRTAGGGRITAGIGQDLIPGNFFTNCSTGVTIIGLVFESLIRYRNDKVVDTRDWRPPGSWPTTGKSITLDLRDDVKFHSGRPFTSKDVEASIKAYADPKWNGQLRSTAVAVTSFDTSAPHRVVLKFEHPLSNILDLLDTAPIIDSETLDKIATGEAFVGTGPFKWTKWVPNASLTRNENYWVPERPYVDGVDVKVVTDPKALLSALKSGQIEYAAGLSYRDMEVLVKSDGFAIEGAEQQIYVGANVTVGPLKDLRVRQAIAYAIDRERIVTEVLRGVGYTINLPWPKYSPAFDAQENASSRDVDKARKLVADYGKVPSITYTYSNASPLLEATAAIVQSNLAEVGIPVELDPVDQAQFVKQLIGAQFAGIWIAVHSWAQYTPSTLTVSAYPFNAHKNASRYESTRYIAHADAAWTVPDGTSAAAVADYAKLSDELLGALFLIEIAVVQGQWATSAKLQGLDYTKRSELLLTDAWVTPPDRGPLPASPAAVRGARALPGLGPDLLDPAARPGRSGHDPRRAGREPGDRDRGDPAPPRARPAGAAPVPELARPRVHLRPRSLVPDRRADRRAGPPG